MDNYNGWRVQCHKGPILTSAETDAFEKELDMPSMPEMLHGSSVVRFTHLASGKGVSFTAKEALRLWRATCFEREPPQVVHSVAWQQERAAALADLESKRYDWTFASEYAGTLEGGAVLETTTERIPYEKLKIQEPIQLFDSLVLFQDELADNGDCIESVKLRVMPSGFFCLHRLFTRVDDVVCTIRDTRVYHAFGSPLLLHEYQVRSNTFAELKPKRLDPSKYADDAFMWEQLTARSNVTTAVRLL